MLLLNLNPILKNREYRLLYTGQFVSLFGSMMTYVAVPYQIYELTHSSFLVGITGATQLAPLIMTALIGGSFADRMNRRKLLITSEIAMMLLAFGFFVNSLLPHPSVTAIFIISALMSAVNGFHRPALEALTPRLVDKSELPAIGALGSLRFSFSAIVGPAFAGTLIAKFGVKSTFVIDTLTFLVSLIALYRMRPLQVTDAAGATEDAPTGNHLSSIREGLVYAKSRPELMGTYFVDIVAMIFAMPMALFPAIADSLGGPKHLSWLYSGMSVGALIVTVLSRWTEKVDRKGAGVIIAATLWGVSIIGFGFSHHFFVAFLFLVAAGATDGVSAIFRSTMWNETIPNDYRGRLAGIEMLSYMSGPLLGNARAGAIASMTSNTFSIVSGGFICVAGVLACIRFMPAFWNYRSFTPEVRDLSR